MERFKALADRIDALSLRERGIILAGIIFVLYSAWDLFLMQPQVVQERNLLADLQIKRAEQGVLNIRFQKLLAGNPGDPGAGNRRRLEELKDQLDRVDSEVSASAKHLVSPANMARILRLILNKSGGLQLTEIRGLGAKPLLEQQDAPGSSAAAPAASGSGATALENAYKHGLVIRFEGDYFSTLNYIRELEALEWEFFWENLEYEVTEYPRGRIMLTLYTLSLDKEWIGV